MAAPSLILLQNIVSGTSLERLTTHIAQMPLLVFLFEAHGAREDQDARCIQRF